jgi:hypothetical protein
VTITVAATLQIGEIGNHTPLILQIAEPVVPEAPVNEPEESTSHSEVSVPNSQPAIRLNLPTVVGRRGTERTPAVAQRSATEVVLLNANFEGAPEARPAGRVLSLVRDDIFDTFHSTRLRLASEMPDELFAELAVEVAGLD